MPSAAAASVEGETANTHEIRPKKPLFLLLLLLYMIFTIVGVLGGPLIQRLYYINGGTLRWFQSWILSIGCLVWIPMILFFEILSTNTLNRSIMDLRLFIYSVGIGILYGLSNYMYSTALAYFPVSTSYLLVVTQLEFTALFGSIIMKQTFTFYSYNSVIVMTLGAVVLSLHANADRPPSISEGEYYLGVFISLGEAVLCGVTSRLIELAYSRSHITDSILMQTKVVMNIFAALFTTVGLLASGEYKDIPEEARLFAMGEVKYYVIIVSSTLIWQLSEIKNLLLLTIQDLSNWSSEPMEN